MTEEHCALRLSSNHGGHMSAVWRKPHFPWPARDFHLYSRVVLFNMLYFPVAVLELVLFVNINNFLVCLIALTWICFICFDQIELPAKLLDYFLRSNKSNISQRFQSSPFRLLYFPGVGGYPKTLQRPKWDPHVLFLACLLSCFLACRGRCFSVLRALFALFLFSLPSRVRW